MYSKTTLRRCADVRNKNVTNTPKKLHKIATNMNTILQEARWNKHDFNSDLNLNPRTAGRAAKAVAPLFV